MRNANYNRGLSLIELMMAVTILALAVLPAIGAFSGYYGLATRQLEQETALKIAEGTLNKLMTHKYSDFFRNEPFTVQLNFETPEGSYDGSLKFGNSAGSAPPVSIGRASYSITASSSIIFEAQDMELQHDRAMVLNYPTQLPLPDSNGNSTGVATYSSFDDQVLISVNVRYGESENNRIGLAAFRADITR